MCTIIIAHNVNDKYPLIVGANRDEFYDRPSQEPDFLQLLPLAVVAPKDLRLGGTWIGAAQGGWFVGLTNQDDVDLMIDKKSRGEVVRDCLLMSDHRTVAKYLNSLNPKDYNPFNLVFGRPGALFLCRVHHDKEIDLEIIPEGVTVVTNDCNASQRYLRREQRAGAGTSFIWNDDDKHQIVNSLKHTLSRHDNDTYQSLCVHDENLNFGTKSSTAILITPDGDVDYYHSEGHPCSSSEFKHYHHLMSLDFSDLKSNISEITDDDILSIE
jgi:uncharacterized protein with NRDE domain